MLQLRTQDAPQPIATPFVINPDLDLDALAREYSETSRVRIHGLLSDGAFQLFEYLDQSEDWIHLMITSDGILELNPAARAKMSAKRRAALEIEVHERVRTAFQYRYQALRVPDEDDGLKERSDPLADFARLMSSQPMLDLLRSITGHGGLAFTDGQATAYGPGDFLTGHDDDVAGRNRLAAYVFGMTPRWRPEYGGLLLFHGQGDRTVTGQTPMFNTLDLFKVPQRHSVSLVSPAAPHRRFAVTGWLRGGTR